MLCEKCRTKIADTSKFCSNCGAKNKLNVSVEKSVQSKKLSVKETELIRSLPYVIAYPLERTILEEHSWTRINLLKDTLLNYLKYLGLFTASEFFSSPFKDKNIIKSFHSNLGEPSFGNWNAFIRECLNFLKEKEYGFFCPELPAYYEKIETGKKRKLYKGEIEDRDTFGDIQIKKQKATAIGMLINFRNRYLGHGLTLDEAESDKIWDEYYPIFLSLLKQMEFSKDYPMLKKEDNNTYMLMGRNINTVESDVKVKENIWVQDKKGKAMPLIPFFIVPGEIAIEKEKNVKVLSYESYTGKTIKFFSPEGMSRSTSGRALERLNLMLRDKQKEKPFTPSQFTKKVFQNRIDEENSFTLKTLTDERKIIPGVYQNREEIEIKLREWIGAMANIFFIAAEAGSGKTNLLVEIQKQYKEQKYPSLLIRAGRMTKKTIKEEICYLLNIDPSLPLDKYRSIAGKQNSPTFILIDGLNESDRTEAIWQEILEISDLFEAGSLKFIISSRANSRKDIEKYKLSDKHTLKVYHESKDKDKTLSSFAFWLTPLDMKEMEGAWNNYIEKDKNRFKPKFSFNDIASFDRAIYKLINNPLVLRLFLETYKRKPLPKKGKKHLHIWKDWLQSFSTEEQKFFDLMAGEVWKTENKELLLDDLLKNETLKSYLRSDQINSPYKRLLNLGWISRYVKGLDTYLTFTVDGVMIYLLGIQFKKNISANIKDIQEIIEKGPDLKLNALEAWLTELAYNDDLEIIAGLIDKGGKGLDLCITPLLYYIKNSGVDATIDNLLKDPTENDWKAFLKLIKRLDDLQLHEIREFLLNKLMPLNKMLFKEAFLIGLTAIQILDRKDAEYYLTNVDTQLDFINKDADILFKFGGCEYKLGNYDKALLFYQNSLDIRLKSQDNLHSKVATSYNSIGSVYNKKGEYDQALEFCQKGLDIQIEISDNQQLAESYDEVGGIFYYKGEYKKSLGVFSKKS